MIQLHRLEGFYRVALAKGYTRAAREFPYPISQPGVHQQVRKLEEELGCTLFQRTGRDRVELTSTGRVLFDFSAPFFEQLPAVVRAISQQRIGGVLRIDAAPLEIRHVLPSWLKRLRRARADIEIALEEVQTPDLARLRRGDTDLVVDHVPEPPDDLCTRQIATHYAFLITPASYRTRGGLQRSLATLQQQPFIGYNPSLFQHAIQLRGLNHLGLSSPCRLSASSTEAILGLVQAELGYSLIPWPSLTGPRVAGVRAVRLRAPGAAFPVMVAWRERSVPDPLVEAAISLL